MLPKILNTKGEEIVLTKQEQMVCNENDRKLNALGFEIPTTTLTQILKKVSEQKLFEIAPADYVPVKVGEGAFSDFLLKYRSFSLGDDFSTGIVSMGGGNSRLASVGTGVDSVTVAVKNWAKEHGWSLFELQQAARAGNWDLITSLEKSRKQNWDLGIQRLAFLGLKNDSSVLGLLNQSVTNNTALITAPISLMSPVDLKAFLAGLLDAYRANCKRTAWPTHFVIPESDYLGLAAPASSDFPIRSTLSLLEETLQIMTRNKGFKVLPLAYGDVAYNELGVTRYAFYNADEDSMALNIPVDYTSTLANSVNNFQFQSAAYGQFSGLAMYRPDELMYFSY